MVDPAAPSVTVGELAAMVGAVVEGDPERRIRGVASLASADGDDLTFLADRRLLPLIEETAAGAVVTSAEFASLFHCPRLVVDDPYRAFVVIARRLTSVAPRQGVHATAVIGEGATLGVAVSIGPFAVIGTGARLGDRCVIGAHTSVGDRVEIGSDSMVERSVVIHERCVIGERCVIDSGAVIGATGFGFLAVGDGWEPIPQLGRVIIGDDVYVGANTAIDRGTLDDTRIGDGVKLDNQIQIAHNVTIGAGTIIAGCTGIAGSARIGRRCRIGGRVSILGHLEICDDVRINATSVVTRSLSSPGVYSSVIGVQRNERWRRNSARIHRLDELERRLRRCESRLPDARSPADPTGDEPVE